MRANLKKGKKMRRQNRSWLKEVENKEMENEEQRRDRMSRFPNSD